MEKRILIGRGETIDSIPFERWGKNFPIITQKVESWLRFMTQEDHWVRNFAVRELPRVAEPIQPELFAQKLGLSLTDVVDILGMLEKKLTFVVRDAKGAVTWAFPVTVVDTPHHLTFSTGERINGA